MRLLFMGTPDFAVPSLEGLVAAGHELVAVVTQPDRPSGRGRILTPPPVKVTAERLGLAVWQPHRINGMLFVEQAANLDLDAIVVVAYGRILPGPLLRASRLGAVNVHASLLPKYRGAAPVHRAIINGERQSGVTIMQMDEGMDTGGILCQEPGTIDSDTTAGQLYDQLRVLGAQLLVNVLPRLAAGAIRPVPQDDSQACYAPRLTAADERVDWQKPAVEVHNRIRGLNPRPGAYFEHAGHRIGITGSRLVQQPGRPARSGQIVAIGRQGVIVACGEGEIELTTLRPAGRKEMSAAAVMHGWRLTVGDQL
ncbi:MAG: methionyl-tRNA formyltransferase [Negativicutes bacterium]|nr:methionyl-tRNA formyltransferase [Negativicutes bacterium]